MAMNDSYIQLLTSFLQQYVHIPKAGYNEDGTVSDSCAKQAFHLLLNEGVFEDPLDLQKQAFQDFGILIPVEMM